MTVEQNAQAKKALEADKAIVYFSAEWCQPCKTFFPQMKSLVSDFPDVTLVKVDVEKNLPMAAMAQVKVVPAMIFLRQGKQVGGQKIGMQNIDDMRDFLTDVFNDNRD